ncbi:MAG: 23S rRNA (adenine(2503)-C(2))-methyltransferase RlmN [Bacteroidetes bacterium]|nr:23S rRNA (adenine(2503)-C(2))-methyltransferase RlmN [Bacteroidota bacterium]
MKDDKIDIKTLDPQEYIAIIKKCGEKPFRAKQLHEWLWKKHAHSFDDMTNLSSELREKLSKEFFIGYPKITSKQQSKDNTIKIAFRLFDNSLIEGVIIPSGDRLTACISSQVGCALGCKFCATATMGFKRNLMAYEIYDQLAEIEKIALEQFDDSISNVVLMGMGEPLLNYDEVSKAINFMTTSNGMGMSPSRITLSTAGIISGIKQMADDNVKYNLAISLHTADNEKRSRIMPTNTKNDLFELKKVIQYFHEQTGSRITYEYLFLKGFNDTLDDAALLAEFCKISPCKINIIEYNPVNGIPFKPGSKQDLSSFVRYLENKNLIVNIRQSKGADIDAACGQLACRIERKKDKNNEK